MSDFTKLETAALVGLFVTAVGLAKQTFLESGKLLFALEAKMPRADAEALLDKKGITKHTIKNARQAADVWERAVAAGHADEAWFDQLTFMDCVLLNRAITKLTVTAVVQSDYFKRRPAMGYGTLEKLLDTPEKPAAKEKEKEKDKEKPKGKDAESSKEGEEPPAGSDTPGDANAAALSKLEKAEKAILALVGTADQTTAEALYQRMLSMKIAVETAMAARWPEVDVESLASIATRATA